MASKKPDEMESSLANQVCDSFFTLAQTELPEEPMLPLVSHLEEQLKPGSNILLFEPHADDVAIACGSLAIALSEMGYRVLQICLYSGERSSGFPDGLTPQMRRRIRCSETILASHWLGTHPRFLAMQGYNQKGYRPTMNDREMMKNLILQTRPSAVFCPPGTDRHPAHRAARALIAWSLWATQWQCPIVTYSTPWGQPWQHNACHVFDTTTGYRKLQAVRAYASQQGVNANYAKFCRHQGRAWLGLLQQLTCGPYFVPEKQAEEESLDGVEVFQLERPAPEHLAWDPVQQVLAAFAGTVTLESDVLRTDAPQRLTQPVTPSRKGTSHAHTVR